MQLLCVVFPTLLQYRCFNSWVYFIQIYLSYGHNCYNFDLLPSLIQICLQQLPPHYDVDLASVGMLQLPPWFLLQLLRNYAIILWQVFQGISEPRNCFPWIGKTINNHILSWRWVKIEDRKLKKYDDSINTCHIAY